MYNLINYFPTVDPIRTISHHFPARRELHQPSNGTRFEKPRRAQRRVLASFPFTAGKMPPSKMTLRRSRLMGGTRLLAGRATNYTTSRSAAARHVDTLSSSLCRLCYSSLSTLHFARGARLCITVYNLIFNLLLDILGSSKQS